MKKNIFLLLALLFTLILDAQVKITNTYANYNSADQYWHQLPKESLQNLEQNIDSNLIRSYFQKHEIFCRIYREKGILFWRYFPEDIRRFTWLINTLYFSPLYWMNINDGAKNWTNGIYSPISVDHKQIERWREMFTSYKRELLSSNLVTDSVKKLFNRLEFYSYLMNNLNMTFRNTSKIDLANTKVQFLKTANEYFVKGKSVQEDENLNPLRTIDMLFLYRNYYGLSLDDLLKFVSGFKESNIPQIKLWSTQKKTLLMLRNNPIKINAKSISGANINMDQLKGKVVLLDFWATWCSTCISRMKYLRDLSNKYKEQDFQIISICINPESDIEEVKKIEKEMNLHWPLLIIGGKPKNKELSGLAKTIWERYGFSGVPQLILIDKKGLMIEYNGVLQTGDVEPLLNKCLIQ